MGIYAHLGCIPTFYPPERAGGPRDGRLFLSVRKVVNLAIVPNSPRSAFHSSVEIATQPRPKVGIGVPTVGGIGTKFVAI
jgi:hypothetical protein